MIKKYIKREKYLKRIKPFIDKDIIKVLVGQRRVGKSYMLYQIMDVIKKQNPHANIIYINKELYDFDKIIDYKNLMDYVKKESKKRERNYIFIDEVQDIKGFERALRSLKAQGNYDIYCTGSNATLLSGELATYLSGRYIEIEIHGLDYKEFLKFHKLDDSDDTLIKYIKYGSLPYLKHLELEDEVVFDYLRNVYNTILLKDVVARHNIRNVSFLKDIVEYIADNLGSLISAKKVSDFLNSQNITISPNMVLDYLAFLVDAFFLYKVKRLDIKGKKIFEINDKFYFEDLGLRNTVVNYRPDAIGQVLENLVFKHYLSNGYKVHVGKIGEHEVDFVCDKDGEREYVQVAYHIHEDNKKREFGNLLNINDNYRKIVVSMDNLGKGATYKGIEHLHIRELLLS